MRAAIYNGPGDITVEEVPRPTLDAPTDAIVRVTHTAICGSDLWFYRGDSDREAGSRVGHEPMGIILQGTLDPAPIFTKTVDLDGVPAGYRAMDEREAIKVLVEM